MLEEKQLGQVFTPVWVAQMMLEMLKLTDSEIESKTFLEPSFGQGVFLFQLLDLYAEIAQIKAFSPEETSELIDSNVYGIELDEQLYSDTVQQLKDYAWSEYGLRIQLPNLAQGDALDYETDKCFDYIIGNPPYVRIHNIPLLYRTKLKERFTHSSGTSDLYVIFFEKCLQLLSPQGQLVFITPNSWLKNVSQGAFREELLVEKRLAAVVDFGSSRIFDSVDTYTAITHIKNNAADLSSVRWERRDGSQKVFEVAIPYSGFNNRYKDPIVVSETGLMTPLKGMRELRSICKPQNGVATLGDKYFLLSPSDIRDNELESIYIRDIVKCSTYKGNAEQVKKVFFPYTYNENGKWEGITEEAFKREAPNLYSFYLAKKPQLETRSIDPRAQWFWYGRSQAIQETGLRKLIIPHTIASNTKRLSTNIVPANTICYSGLFITEIAGGEPLEFVQKCVESEGFADYVKKVGKNIAQGYKTFSSRLVGNYQIR